MSAMSDYLENKIIDHILRGTPYTAPSGNVYIGLLTTTPSDTGGGTEVSGGSYARANVAATLSGWTGTHGGSGAVSSGTSGFANNATSIVFPAPSANWGVVNGFGMYDAYTGGNLLFYGNLTIAKTINNGDAAPSFAANTLCIQIDN
jgi:hypothetical protein